LNSLLKAYRFPRREQDMKVVRHEDKLVQLVETTVATGCQLLNHDVRSGFVTENLSPLPSLRGHKKRCQLDEFCG
jgi:hypothetical protein